MPHLHIANTFFEHELSKKNFQSLKEGFHNHPIFLQLQYLPFLYASPEDCILLTHAPPLGFLDNLRRQGIRPPTQWYIFSDRIPFMQVNSWGMSRLVETWAQEHQLKYSLPAYELIQEMNSKAFSYSFGEQLPLSQLLYTHEHFVEWVEKVKGPKVLKTCYGLSGQGHFHLSSDESTAKAHAFAKAEWQQNRPILAEPWVKRILDFSTQWYVTKKEIEYCGATICENDKFGRYLGTRVGDEKELFQHYLPFLEIQKERCLQILMTMVAKGFFGHAGIDAMVYELDAKIQLHPLVEINARKTMGWVALEIAKRHFSGRALRIALNKSDISSSPFLLPQQIAKSHFYKNLYLQA